jgi:hypothetical protein
MYLVCRTIRLSDYRTVELLERRTIGMSDYRSYPEQQKMSDQKSYSNTAELNFQMFNVLKCCRLSFFIKIIIIIIIKKKIKINTFKLLY